MKLITSYKIAIIAVFTLFLLNSCSKELETDIFENSSLVTVKLQAAQSAFSKVNIDIQEVQLRVLEDESDPNAWISLNTINTGVHDITQFSNNQVVLLVDYDEVQSRLIHNIRIVYGDENSAVMNGITYELDMSPTAENASVNIIDKHLISNKLYEFVVEIDVENSIQVSDEGEAELTPKMNTLLRLFNLF